MFYIARIGRYSMYCACLLFADLKASQGGTRETIPSIHSITFTSLQKPSSSSPAARPFPGFFFIVPRSCLWHKIDSAYATVLWCINHGNLSSGYPLKFQRWEACRVSPKDTREAFFPLVLNKRLKTTEKKKQQHHTEKTTG